MERTKYIPSIVSLLGGLIACIFTMLNPYETYEIFLFVFVAMIVFYIVGAIIRIIINKVLFVTKVDEDSETEEEGDEATENNEESDVAPEETSEGEQV